ncbi:hypothetical protein OTB20_32870 [Streptomyces sp. H27-H1]|uniref:hypothetical protein n=1 Tax=Streptomyces sp. H27-H1 TaxID=2996461 RepID=UPI00226F355B|nr:hypothetical protein [Streptomyces sp. H27-H1]MCY0930904.1 hypothetical protein [Streptomyces sp. H27-H1]
MTDIAVGAVARRSATTGQKPAVPAQGTSSEAQHQVPCGVWGDELRARAWLWRRLGIGTYAGSGGTE